MEKAIRKKISAGRLGAMLRIGALLLAATLLLSLRLNAAAAPKTMPDGGTFDAAYYAAQNPDVVAVLGANEAILYQHYLLCGRAEGRLPYAGAGATPTTTQSYPLPDGTEFDPVYYAQTYPDVAAALGTAPALLYQHYLQYGQQEGRQPHAPMKKPVASSDGITEEVAYQRLSALQGTYPEGMRWDMSVGGYLFESLPGWRIIGYECAGYAFILSDTIFGKTQNTRRIENYDPAAFHVGDILRYYNNSGGEHSVVIWKVSDDGITVTEGNYGGKVHWGRQMSWNEVAGRFIYLMTRYEP